MEVFFKLWAWVKEILQLKNILTFLLIVTATFSVLSIFFTLRELAILAFDFSPIGFQKFLNFLQPYSYLYAATFVVLATKLTVNRIELQTTQQRESFKFNNYSMWISGLKYGLDQINEDDPNIVFYFQAASSKLHSYLYARHFKIKNSVELAHFYDSNIRGLVKTFEENNPSYKTHDGYYLDEAYSYSFGSIKKLFMFFVNEGYISMIDDFEKLYMEELSQNEDRKVNAGEYNKREEIPLSNFIKE